MQIDRPMMSRAVAIGGRTLVAATHGPTVHGTQALLAEPATAAGARPTFSGVTVEEAWHRLARGDVRGHNAVLAEAIHDSPLAAPADSVVLAQLSMTVLLLSYPDPRRAFGVPVLTSGQVGFEAVSQLLRHRRGLTGVQGGIGP